ncbi:Vinorine synthase [Bertholletia excelsa]
MLQIEIISKETIRPSSSHPLTYQLSFIDQIIPPLFIPFILHYPIHHPLNLSQPSISSTLKRSLSDALTLYYPLAGRPAGDYSVHCNDAGITYLEARVHARLSDLVGSPRVDSLSQLVPSAGGVTSGKEQLAIQVNFFADGSVSIAIGFSHRVADAATIASFINAWATACQGGTGPTPSFVAADLFPPKEPLGYQPRAGDPNSDTNRGLVYRRLNFGSAKLAALRAEASASGSGSCPARPTRVELVTALIWRSLVGGEEDLVVAHMVNLRWKVDLELPENTFGNIFMPVFASGGAGGELGTLVGKIRKAIKGINREYIESYFRENGFAERMNNIKKGKEVKIVRFSSWCRLPLYEADFGWGKPSWVSVPVLGVTNSVILMDSMEEGGIDAWVTLGEEDVKKLEEDSGLLAFASVT